MSPLLLTMGFSTLGFSLGGLTCLTGLNRGLDTFILPHVKEAARTGEDRHIVLVAHGIHNSTLPCPARVRKIIQD